VKENTVPACRVGDSACDPEDDVNGYCCPEGTITGGSSIEDVMINGKSVQKTVLKCIGTKRCADDSGEDAPKEAPSDETPSSEIEPCLAGDKACGDSATFPYATDNFGLAYGPKVDACCPENTSLSQRLHNTAVSLTCQGAASSRCAGQKGALKKALKKKVDAKVAKKKKAAAAAEKAKADAKSLKEKAAADARKAAQSKAAADAASKIASAKVAAAKSTAANQPAAAAASSAHAGYAGTSVIFSGPGCTGKAIKTTSFTVGQCIRGERGGSTKANRCSVGGTWEFTSFSDSECKQVATPPPVRTRRAPPDKLVHRLASPASLNRASSRRFG
jgi:hypothetical protein